LVPDKMAVCFLDPLREKHDEKKTAGEAILPQNMAHRQNSAIPGSA
jgi:hypothetical protein